jgi:hypothetical protein
MRLGIELLPARVDCLDAIPLQRFSQRSKHQQNSMGQSIVGVSFGVQSSRLQRPLQIVKHRNYIPGKLPSPARVSRLQIRGHPLAKVFEVGFRPLGEIEVLIPLSLGVSEQPIEIVFDLLGVRGLTDSA